MKTIEERLELIERALKILQKWITQQEAITQDDTELFDQINKRLTKLEEEDAKDNI